MSEALKRIQRAEIKARYAVKARRREFDFRAVRIRELQKLRRARYPDGVPNSPDGRTLVIVLCHHLVMLAGDPRRRLKGVLEDIAPWLTLAEANQIMIDAMMRPLRWRARRLGWKLKLLAKDRATLRITTIGAIDTPPGLREAKRKAIQRTSAEKKRRAAGAKSRAQYLAEVAAPKPWIAMGMSRAKWYRLGKPTA